MVLRAHDRVVAGVVQIGGVRRHFVVVRTRHAVVSVGRTGPEGTGVTDLGGFLPGRFAPYTCLQVNGVPFRRQQVHGYQPKLGLRAAAHEQDGVFLTAAEQNLQVGDGLLMNFVVYGPPVAGFQDGHAGAAEVEQFGLGPLQDGQRQRRWSRVEIVHARRHDFPV